MGSRSRAAARRLLFTLATSDRLEAAARRLGPVDRVCYARARRYVAGTGWSDVVSAAERLADLRIWVSADFFGERVTDPDEARAVTDRYVELAGEIGKLPGEPALSIDLSHIGLDAGTAQCRELLGRICAALPDGVRVQVGAEEVVRHAPTHEIVLALARDGAPLMVTLQANVRASATAWQRFAEAGVPVRLVKGAYVESPDLAHPWGPATDRAFLALAEELLQAAHPFAAATHDPEIQSKLAEAMPDVEFEQLLGVRPEAAAHLAAAGHTVRVYVPFGPDWFRYWMRRMAESVGA